MSEVLSPPWALGGFTPGSRIAGYRLEEQIGQGGMAIVFRAHDERLNRQVALKILAPALAADVAFRQRFIRESQAAAAVDDPNIIPVFEAGEAGRVLFIAMRLVRGGDLRSLVSLHGPLTPARAEWIVSAVASALDAAHAAGLVHRDVKPANMLLDRRPGRPDHVYVSDFGLSKSSLGSSSLTGSGHFLGTVDYAAPEQIEGRDVDGRTDQYALGCSAFELLCGRPPYKRDQGLAAIYAHLSAAPPALTALRPGLRLAVDGVFAKVLAKAQDDRYASCQDFADHLREALGIQPYATEAAGSGRERSATDVVWTGPREAAGRSDDHDEIAAPDTAAAEAAAAAAEAAAAEAAAAEVAAAEVAAAEAAAAEAAARTAGAATADAPARHGSLPGVAGDGAITPDRPLDQRTTGVERHTRRRQAGTARPAAAGGDQPGASGEPARAGAQEAVLAGQVVPEELIAQEFGAEEVTAGEAAAGEVTAEEATAAGEVTAAGEPAAGEVTAGQRIDDVAAAGSDRFPAPAIAAATPHRALGETSVPRDAGPTVRGMRRVSVRETTPPEPAPGRRRRAPVMIASAAGIIVLGSVGVILATRSPGHPAPSSASVTAGPHRYGSLAVVRRWRLDGPDGSTLSERITCRNTSASQVQAVILEALPPATASSSHAPKFTPAAMIVDSGHDARWVVQVPPGAQVSVGYQATVATGAATRARLVSLAREPRPLSVSVSPAQQGVRLRSLKLSPGRASVVAGRTVKMRLSGKLSNGHGAPGSDLSHAVWKSANSRVATVSASGVVTGVGAGQTRITAAVGAVRASALIIVRAVQPTSGTTYNAPAPSSSPTSRRPTASHSSHPSSGPTTITPSTLARPFGPGTAGGQPAVARPSPSAADVIAQSTPQAFLASHQICVMTVPAGLLGARLQRLVNRVPLADRMPVARDCAVSGRAHSPAD